MDAIVIENLTKTFGTFTALHGIDLSVRQGEFLGLLGPSGCGKTTTLNIIAGFEPASGGRILLNGKDLTGVPVNRRGIGVVFQSYALFPHMTVAENVAFGLEMRRVSRANRDAAVRRALDLVHLQHVADRYPRAISGGQQQRVALARAMAIEPALLLLDEPLSNLDAKLREEMQVELRTIQQRVGTTTVMVTHDQSEALAACDRIAVMQDGRIVQQTDPLSLYNRPNTRFSADFVGKSSILEARVLAGDMVRVRGGGVVAIPPGRATEGDLVHIALRPEKVVLVPGAPGLLKGIVTAAVFQGALWLYQLDTPAGRVTACVLNSGDDRLVVGQEVGIAWDAADVILLAEERAA
ncbi:ABC transporter ATP-binding protein [Cereibacter sp. SYSU M97828]|nr:ABC transporter ATP-binding protein [Cereibacter flavus]